MDDGPMVWLFLALMACPLVYLLWVRRNDRP
jgi:hypothetical protein